MPLVSVVLNVSPNFSFILSLVYFSSFFLLDIVSCLWNLVAAWNCISVAHNSLEAILASYHNQVSKFVEELLIARFYFEGHTNYWVDSGLVSNSKAKTSIFKAAEAACNLKKGLSLQDTASTLFHSYLVFVHAFCQGILSSRFSGNLPDPLTFEEHHQQVLDEQMSAAESSSKKGKSHA